MPPASILSPLAPPFYPAYGNPYEYESFAAIYNNGMPAMVCVGEHPDHEVLHNIQDDALDEAFPPTAEEVAEMEAADFFVQIMADLSFLEDREEKARNELSHVTRKRWETRRQEGLKGKPHPASSLRLDHTVRNGNIANLQEHSLVPRGDHHLTTRGEPHIESRLRAKELGRQSDRMSKNNMKGLHGFTKTIQQPRKQN